MTVPAPPRRKWRQKWWWAAAALVWTTAYLAAVAPIHYAAMRGWLPQTTVRVYVPLEAILRVAAEISEATGSELLRTGVRRGKSAYYDYRHIGMRLGERHSMEEDVQMVIDALEREIASRTDPARRAALREDLEEWREKLATMHRTRWTLE